MELTKEERDEMINNLPAKWLTDLYNLKEGKIGKRTIQRVVLHSATDLHGILPIAVNMAATEIIRRKLEAKKLEKSKQNLKKALQK